MKRVVIDTKQNLIDTALDLLWKNSYGSVSVDDICKAAAVKKGSFYHFFPSKVDLALAAMDETSKTSRQMFDTAFSAGSDPVKRFEDYADLVCAKQAEAAEKYGHVCGCPCTSLGSEMAGQEDRISEKFEEISQLHQRYFESALRDMVADGLIPGTVDVKNKAKEIYVYVLGQMMVARIENSLDMLRKDLKPGILRQLGVKGTSQQAA